MNTSHKIINLLNRKDATVSQLATELGISRNSAHLQIVKLEAAGIVEKYYPEQQTGAGKPAHFFRVVTGREDTYSTAHHPILVGLVETIHNQLPEKDRAQLLENAGRLIAQTVGLSPTGELADDLGHAVHEVNGLGAMAEICMQEDGLHVNCYSCPVASIVHKDPMVCNLVAAFFSEATGKKAIPQCQRARTVVCDFTFE